MEHYVIRLHRCYLWQFTIAKTSNRMQTKKYLKSFKIISLELSLEYVQILYVSQMMWKGIPQHWSLDTKRSLSKSFSPAERHI